MGSPAFASVTLSAQGLACVRGGRPVFAGVDFALSSGQAMVLVGANGSGKSSLLRVLASLTPPAAGALNWCGIDPRRDPETYRAALRYLSHQDAVKPVLRVGETVTFAARLAEPSTKPEAIAAALRALDLDRLADLPARFLSAGQRRRLALARLIATPAPLWLLDEPGAGLDAQSLRVLHTLIEAQRRKGGIVIASTHGDLVLPDAQRLDLGTLARAA
jgi:heme exporter protein A